MPAVHQHVRRSARLKAITSGVLVILMQEIIVIVRLIVMQHCYNTWGGKYDVS